MRKSQNLKDFMIKKCNSLNETKQLLKSSRAEREIQVQPLIEIKPPIEEIKQETENNISETNLESEPDFDQYNCNLSKSNKKEKD